MLRSAKLPIKSKSSGLGCRANGERSAFCARHGILPCPITDSSHIDESAPANSESSARCPALTFIIAARMADLFDTNMIQGPKENGEGKASPKDQR